VFVEEKEPFLCVLKKALFQAIFLLCSLSVDEYILAKSGVVYKGFLKCRGDMGILRQGKQLRQQFLVNSKPRSDPSV